MTGRGEPPAEPPCRNILSRISIGMSCAGLRPGLPFAKRERGRRDGAGRTRHFARRDRRGRQGALVPPPVSRPIISVKRWRDLPARGRERGVERGDWGRQVLAAAGRRLRGRLAPGLRLVDCTCSRRGVWWTVRLCCRQSRGAEATSEGRLLHGCGHVCLPRSYLPGDPRLGRRLQLALAAALTEVAQESGLGLRICRWTVRPTPSSRRDAAAGGGGRRI